MVGGLILILILISILVIVVHNRFFTLLTLRRCEDQPHVLPCRRNLMSIIKEYFRYETGSLR